MDIARKATLGLAVLTTLFVLGTAIYTGNAALYLLTGLAAASGLLTWQQGKRGA